MKNILSFLCVLICCLLVPSHTQENDTALFASVSDLEALAPTEYCLDGSNTSFVSFGEGVGQFGTKDFYVAISFNTEYSSGISNMLGNRVSLSHGNFFNIRFDDTHDPTSPVLVSVEVDQDTDATNYISLTTAGTNFAERSWHLIEVIRIANTLYLFVNSSLNTQKSAAGIANISNGNDFILGHNVEPISGSSTACYSGVKVWSGHILMDLTLAENSQLTTSAFNFDLGECVSCILGSCTLKIIKCLPLVNDPIAFIQCALSSCASCIPKCS